jgi:hypothetical protein
MLNVSTPLEVDALPTDGLRRRVRESLGDLRIGNAPAPLPAALQPPIKALEAWLREISL